MGRRFISVARSFAAVALLMVVGWGCPFATRQPTGLSVESQDVASPPEAPQQPVSGAVPPTTELQPAMPRSTANIVTITTPDGALIEYSKDPDTVIVMMTWEGDGMAIRKKPLAPLLRIYGDGRARVRSRLELRLDDEEMERLFTLLQAKGVLGFDPVSTIKVLENIDRLRGRPRTEWYSARAESALRLDAVPLLIEIHLVSYRGADAQAGRGAPLSQTIRWIQVQGDARGYPEVSSIVGLAEAHKELMALVDRVEKQGLVINEEGES